MSQQLTLDLEASEGQRPPLIAAWLPEATIARLARHGWRYKGTTWNEHFKEYVHWIQGPKQRPVGWPESWIAKVDEGIAAVLADLERQ